MCHAPSWTIRKHGNLDQKTECKYSLETCGMQRLGKRDDWDGGSNGVNRLAIAIVLDHRRRTFHSQANMPETQFVNYEWNSSSRQMSMG